MQGLAKGLPPSINPLWSVRLQSEKPIVLQAREIERLQLRLRLRLTRGCTCAGRSAADKGTRDMESSSESDQQRRKSADLPAGSTALPAPSEGMAATEYGQLQGKVGHLPCCVYVHGSACASCL